MLILKEFERVLGWRLVRWVLTAQRAEWLTEAYRQHAMKTVAMARHVAGLRAAALLTDVHRVERWLALAALIGLTGGVVVFVMRSNRRVSKAP